MNRKLFLGATTLAAGGLFFVAGQSADRPKDETKNRVVAQAASPFGVKTEQSEAGHAGHHDANAAHDANHDATHDPTHDGARDLAAHEGHEGHDRMMMHGATAHGDGHPMSMEAGEMNPPALHRVALAAFSLPEMQRELSLSTKQVDTLKQIRSGLIEKQKEIGGKINARQKELEPLLTGETSRTQTVRKLFTEISSLKGQMQYAAFDALHRMKADLDESQRRKLAAVNGQQLHEIAMRSGSMRDVHLVLGAMGAM